MTKPKTSKTAEQILGQLAHHAYLMGRLCGALPASSPVRELLTIRYAEDDREAVEPYCFLVGLTGTGAIMGPDELLGVVHYHVFGPMPAPKPRRQRRPDDRWGARS